MDDNRTPHNPADDATGLPEAADPDSTAYDTGPDRNRIDAAAPPTQPADGPYGIEGFGTSIAAQVEGEPLDGRLARERPDVDPETYEPGVPGRQIRPAGSIAGATSL